MTRPTPVPDEAGGSEADSPGTGSADRGRLMTAQLTAGSDGVPGAPEDGPGDAPDSGTDTRTGDARACRGDVSGHAGRSETAADGGAARDGGTARDGGAAADGGAPAAPGRGHAVDGSAPDGPARTDGADAEAESTIAALWREFGRSPDQRVRDRLVLHYAPLVKYVAGRVGTGLPSHVDVSDLVQSGIFGLVDAIEKFDPERGLRFETYAMQRIRGAILDDLRAQDWVPRVIRSRAREVERAHDRLGARLRRTPTDSEVAAELGVSVRELRDLYGQLRLTSVVALDDLVGANTETGPGTAAETLPDEDAVDPATVLVDRDNRRQLAEAIAQLNERDRIVVSLYYFESLTLAEIGRVLGVTESRVSQLHTRAVLRLRAKLLEQAGT
ncbi:FliA/WhiG family RNA polymerase sigma factor [Saccharomonospora iraqiensis]|uniref:FliA/WhiG family RNA polymerase sigma factor n=1 Tax=Saccharomonospora iraqiensis TaxID=52698 RepID=UPI00022E1264